MMDDKLYKKKMGEALRSERKKIGMPQHELAARINKSRATINSYELGKNGIPRGTLIDINEVLGVTLENIVRGHKTKEEIKIEKLERELQITKEQLINTQKMLIEAQKLFISSKA